MLDSMEPGRRRVDLENGGLIVLKPICTFLEVRHWREIAADRYGGGMNWRSRSGTFIMVKAMMMNLLSVLARVLKQGFQERKEFGIFHLRIDACF